MSFLVLNAGISESSFNLIDERLDVLIKRSTEELKNQGFTESAANLLVKVTNVITSC